MHSHFLILAVGAMVAGFVQGISGFAFGMIAMSFWVWNVEPRVAVVMTVFGGLTGQLLSAIVTRRFALPAITVPFVLGGLLGLPLGVFILQYLDPTPFKVVLGSLLVLFCSVSLLAENMPKITTANRAADAAVGAVGGVMGGICGFTGLAPSLWCVLRGYEKDVARTLLQSFNMVALAATFIAFVMVGAVTEDMLPYFPVVAFALIIPSMVGARVYKGMSQLTFRRVVLALLVCAGLVMLIASVPKR